MQAARPDVDVTLITCHLQPEAALATAKATPLWWHTSPQALQLEYVEVVQVALLTERLFGRDSMHCVCHTYTK